MISFLSVCSQRPLSENADHVEWPRSGFRVSLDVLGWRQEPQRPRAMKGFGGRSFVSHVGAAWKLKLLHKCYGHTHVLIYTHSYGGCRKWIIGGVSFLANFSLCNSTLQTSPCFPFIKIRAFLDGNALEIHMSSFFREAFSKYPWEREGERETEGLAD